jgi:hypothetical protein
MKAEDQIHKLTSSSEAKIDKLVFCFDSDFMRVCFQCAIIDFLLCSYAFTLIFPFYGIAFCLIILSVLMNCAINLFTEKYHISAYWLGNQHLCVVGEPTSRYVSGLFCL